MLAPNTDPTVASIFAPRTTIEPDGTVEGYASLFGEVDQARDMVLRGAFADTLRLRSVRRIPMLFQHDPSEPVGVWLELREDHRGLYARGRLIPDVGRARELLALLRAGAIDGLSIGFRTTKGRIDPRTRVRSLVAVDLWEISIVTFPLLAGARVRAVKHSPSRSQSGFALAEHGAAASPGRPRASLARARAERDWGTVAGGCGAADVPAPRPLIRGGVAVSAKQARRRPDGKRWPGRIRTWRQAEQI